MSNEETGMRNEGRVKLEHFSQLNVWQKGHEFELMIYKITKRFPREEQFGLIQQLRRAANSITSNIAEGFGRFYFKDKQRFYYQARGSIAECQNHLYVARDLGYADVEEIIHLDSIMTEVRKALNGLIASQRINGYKYFTKTALKVAVFILITLSSFLIPPAAHAQQAGQDIAILNASVGARALGMGSAYTAIADGVDAPFWNPAGLAANRFEHVITTMQTRLATDTDHYYVSYIHPFLGGSIGLSWVQLSLGSIQRTAASLEAFNEVRNLGIFSYFSNAYLLAYGQEITPSISVGVTAKYLTSDMFGIERGQGSGYSITPGLLLKPFGDTLVIGAKIDELVNAQNWRTGLTESVPPKLRAGLAYQLQLLPILLSADYSQIVRSGYSGDLTYGAEWTPHSAFSLRAGWSRQGFTAGVGFKQGHAEVNYAYVTQPALSRDNVHRISLTGRW